MDTSYMVLRMVELVIPAIIVIGQNQIAQAGDLLLYFNNITILSLSKANTYS